MITIEVAPQTYSPVGRDIVFVVDSDNKAECSFQYVGDIYVNGVFQTRLKMFPDPVNGYGIFKINLVLKDFVNWYTRTTSTGIQAAPSTTAPLINYQVKFGEEFDSSVNCDAGTILTPNITNSNVNYAWNGCIQYEEDPSFLYTDFVVTTGSTTKRFLTNQPDEIYIGEDDSAYLYFLYTQTGQVDSIQIDRYGFNPSSPYISSMNITNTYMANTNARRFLSVAVGPVDINAVNPGFIDDTVAYYKVFAVDSSLQSTKAYTYIVDRRCVSSNVEKKRFLFLNRLGGFDSYSFTLKPTTKTTISRTEYTKLLGAVDTSSLIHWGFNIGDRGKTTIAVEALERYTATSNWMSPDEARWIAELFTSPMVFIQEGSTIYPVVITSSEHQLQTKADRQLIQYTIEYDAAYTKRIQSN